MPLAMAAFTSATWAATEPNGCGAAGAGSSPTEKFPFQLEPETSWNMVPDVWATAMAAGDSCQPGIPTVKPILSCLHLKSPMGKLALGQVQDLSCPEQSWSLHLGSRWSCTTWLKVFHGGWGQTDPDSPPQWCLPSPPFPQTGQHAQEANKLLLLPHLNQGTSPQRRKFTRALPGQQSSSFYRRLLINYHPFSLPSHLLQAHF